MTILEQNACNAIISMAMKDAPDYWTRLEHTYAGMAMQGIIARHNVDFDMVVEWSADLAHALVEELKEKEERK